MAQRDRGGGQAQAHRPFAFRPTRPIQRDPRGVRRRQACCTATSLQRCEFGHAKAGKRFGGSVAVAQPRADACFCSTQHAPRAASQQAGRPHSNHCLRRLNLRELGVRRAKARSGMQGSVRKQVEWVDTAARNLAPFALWWLVARRSLRLLSYAFESICFIIFSRCRKGPWLARSAWLQERRNGDDGRVRESDLTSVVPQAPRCRLPLPRFQPATFAP